MPDRSARGTRCASERSSGRGGSRTLKAPGTARRVVAPGFEPGAVTHRLALPESIKLQGRDSNPHAEGASLTVRCVYHFATLEGKRSE